MYGMFTYIYHQKSTIHVVPTSNLPPFLGPVEFPSRLLKVGLGPLHRSAFRQYQAELSGDVAPGGRQLGPPKISLKYNYTL